MDEELRIAIGRILATAESITSLLKNGGKSIYYGVDLEIDVKNSIPLIRFFDVDWSGDTRFLNPHQKVECRLQVDIASGSDGQCDVIADQLPSLLCIPGERDTPIKTENWTVDRFFPLRRTRLYVKHEIPGGGKRICVLSTEWTFFAKRNS